MVPDDPSIRSATCCTGLPAGADTCAITVRRHSRHHISLPNPCRSACHRNRTSSGFSLPPERSPSRSVSKSMRLRRPCFSTCFRYCSATATSSGLRRTRFHRNSAVSSCGPSTRRYPSRRSPEAATIFQSPGTVPPTPYQAASSRCGAPRPSGKAVLEFTRKTACNSLERQIIDRLGNQCQGNAAHTCQPHAARESREQHRRIHCPSTRPEPLGEVEATQHCTDEHRQRFVNTPFIPPISP